MFCGGIYDIYIAQETIWSTTWLNPEIFMKNAVQPYVKPYDIAKIRGAIAVVGFSHEQRGYLNRNPTATTQ